MYAIGFVSTKYACFHLYHRKGIVRCATDLRLHDVRFRSIKNRSWLMMTMMSTMIRLSSRSPFRSKHRHSSTRLSRGPVDGLTHHVDTMSEKSAPYCERFIDTLKYERLVFEHLFHFVSSEIQQHSRYFLRQCLVRLILIDHCIQGVAHVEKGRIALKIDRPLRAPLLR